MSRPVIVTSFAEAVAALRNWRAPAVPTLLSAPAAAQFAGALWWRRLIDLAAAETGMACDDWLDCGDAPGQAMAALRAGCRGLVIAPTVLSVARLTELARAHGAHVVTDRNAIQTRLRP